MAPSKKSQQGKRNATDGDAKRVVKVNSGDPHAHYTGNYTSTTKYTVVTFAPKALYEQFRRVANIYFAMVAALSCTDYSPVSPWTTFLPLVLVLGVSIGKEALEDYRRWKADDEINNRLVRCWDCDTGNFEEKKWKDLRPGEVVQVTKDSHFPSDLLFLSSSSPEKLCYVETANLDGESNLKIKKAVDETAYLSSDAHFSTFETRIECEPPNASLYTFTGNLIMKGATDSSSRTIPLMQASMLLRGSSLRNTDHIFGVVIYAGHQTKVMQNSTQPPSKRSKIERLMDTVIIFMFAILFTCCSIGAASNAAFTRDTLPKHWYLRPEATPDEFNPDTPEIVALTNFITSFILYGYLIPISLYVSIEMVKVVQSMVFIGLDHEMYHAESDTPARARTSNLNEELGMVSYVLSDKTGTLTDNKMEFFKCSIAGVSYGTGLTSIEISQARLQGQDAAQMGQANEKAAEFKEKGFSFYDERLMAGAWRERPDADTHKEFFRLLAVCHTAIPDGPADPARIRYEAESPDEAALVVAAKVFGFFCAKRTSSSLIVRETHHTEHVDLEYEVLNILEFNSTRKRMSVIVRTPDSRIVLYCKGADSVIYDRMAHTNPQNLSIRDQTRSHLEEFGSSGLRTLCLAYRVLDQTEYAAWQREYIEARTSLQGRDEKLDAVSEKIERDLILLGATAIEDKLQDGVPECIATLAQAGIRIWVLTGDKTETAINIGYACSLLRDDMTQYIIHSDLPEIRVLEERNEWEAARAIAKEKIGEQLQHCLDHLQSHSVLMPTSALIIDGKALIHALHDDMAHVLLAIGRKCGSVLCCRVSPKQKSQVTALVKRMGETCLGIGDGANDVGMIQEAHIGVGISGQEGMQAVMASDFSIAQFRFLKELLLVHGRWCYKRICRMVCFFFYKNLFYGLTIFFFNIATGFSGQIIYNDLYMSLYNVIFTSLSPLVVGLFDQDVPRHMAIKYPGLYQAGIRNDYFSFKVRLRWLATAVIHAVVTFLSVYSLVQTTSDRKQGSTFGHWQTGVLMFSCVVTTVHLHLAQMLEHWTWIHHLSIWGSIGVWYLFLVVYGYFPPTWSGELWLLFTTVVCKSYVFWLAVTIIPATCFVPDLFLRLAQRHLAPSDDQLLQEVSSLGGLARVAPQGGAAGPGAGGELELCKKPGAAAAEPDDGFRTTRRFMRHASIRTGYVPIDEPGSQGYWGSGVADAAGGDEGDDAMVTQRRPAMRAATLNPAVLRVEEQLWALIQADTHAAPDAMSGISEEANGYSILSTVPEEPPDSLWDAPSFKLQQG